VNTASHNKRKRFSKKDTEQILVVGKQQQQQQETKFTIVSFSMNHSSLMIFSDKKSLD